MPTDTALLHDRLSELVACLSGSPEMVVRDVVEQSMNATRPGRCTPPRSRCAREAAPRRQRRRVHSRITDLFVVAFVATAVFVVQSSASAAHASPLANVAVDLGVGGAVELAQSVATSTAPDMLAARSASFGWGSATEPINLYDWADPDLLFHGDSVYMYATNTLWSNVPYLVADPGGVLQWKGDAMPVMPSWVSPVATWAPSVSKISNQFVLHYTARHTASGKQCIGVATSASPAGPFVDNNGGPLVCALNQGGAIDASVIEDNGVAYLLWKTDGNCCGLPTIIYSQELTADGTAFAGNPIELIRNDRAWEHDVVEGPSMVENGGIWHLFYAAHRWDTANYSTGYARCSTPVGPCVKEDIPLLASGYPAAGPLLGPGGMEVIYLPDSNQDLAVYHGWTDGRVGYHHNQRSAFIQYVDWVNGYPVLTPHVDFLG